MATSATDDSDQPTFKPAAVIVPLVRQELERTLRPLRWEGSHSRSQLARMAQQEERDSASRLSGGDPPARSSSYSNHGHRGKAKPEDVDGVSYPILASVCAVQGWEESACEALDSYLGRLIEEELLLLDTRPWQVPRFRQNYTDEDELKASFNQGLVGLTRILPALRSARKGGGIAEQGEEAEEEYWALDSDTDYAKPVTVAKTFRQDQALYPLANPAVVGGAEFKRGRPGDLRDALAELRGMECFAEMVKVEGGDGRKDKVKMLDGIGENLRDPREGEMLALQVRLCSPSLSFSHPRSLLISPMLSSRSSPEPSGRR